MSIVKVPYRADSEVEPTSIRLAIYNNTIVSL